MDKAAVMNQVLEAMVDSIDVPPSHYRLAIERYEALGRWFHREGSPVAKLEPKVFPQGSFRLGTPTRPVFAYHEYDLDLVCHVLMTKGDTTQQQLKNVIGDDVKAYADPEGPGQHNKFIKRAFDVSIDEDTLIRLGVAPAIMVSAAPRIHVSSGPQPWSDRA